MPWELWAFLIWLVETDTVLEAFQMAFSPLTLGGFLTHVLWSRLFWVSSGGHLQVSGFFSCASLSSRVLCPAKSRHVNLLRASALSPQFSESASWFPIPAPQPGWWSLSRREAGQSEGPPLVFPFSQGSLLFIASHPVLWRLLFDKFCLVFFFIVSVTAVKSSLWHSVLKRSRSLLMLDFLGLLICLLLALRESPVPWWRAPALESDHVMLWSTTS